MKIEYVEMSALAADYVNRSVYLSGFSFALLLSIVPEFDHIYRWTIDGEKPNAAQWDVIEKQISQCIRELQMPAEIGAVVPLMVEVIPERYLLMDGGIYQREDYPLLYAVLPASLQLTADTFTLPDMSGLTAVGATFIRPLLTTFGEETHTLTEAEMPIHAHTYTPTVPTPTLEGVGVPVPTAGISPLPTLTGSAGGGFAHNNMQPSISLYWCVVAR